jgi:hypothetical protein
MAKKKKRPPPPRNDAELIERLRKKAPDVLDAEVDFDAIVDAVLTAELKEQKPQLK